MSRRPNPRFGGLVHTLVLIFIPTVICATILIALEIVSSSPHPTNIEVEIKKGEEELKVKINRGTKHKLTPIE